MKTLPKGHFLLQAAKEGLQQILGTDIDHTLNQVGHISGCIKFHVDSESTDRPQLLSVHYPRPERNFRPNPDHLRSRRQFLLDAIETRGIRTPRPTSDPTGKLITPIEVESPYWSGACYCALTEWIEGEPLKKNDQTHIKIVAQAMAELHTFANNWTPASPNFSLPPYDRNIWLEALEKLKKPIEDGRIQAEYHKTLTRAVDAILANTTRDENRWGFIHADLVPGNVLQSNSNVYIIDFDNAGFGSFAHDIAWTLTQLTPDLRRQFIETYAQTYQLPVMQTIEDHFILSQLYHLSWWVNDPGYDFHQIPSLCQHCEQRLSGTPFLFE